MIVLLAGFNLEFSRIPDHDDATPEAISAAYARISRSSKRVDDLRRQAVRDVDAARRSNQRIVFGMGHSSVAEHAVFNFDLIGISRYLSEYVQKSRLASFTEKSQRYVTLHGDFVTPAEIAGTPIEAAFRQLIETQNDLYRKLIEAGRILFRGRGLSEEVASERAREDARYVLSLATETQMGATLNARSLERLLRRLGTLPMAEAHTLRDRLLDLTGQYAPSLVRYTDPEPYDTNRIIDGPPSPTPWAEAVRLSDNTPDPDRVVMTAALVRDMGMDPVLAAAETAVWDDDRLREAFERLFRDMTSHQPAPETFEFAGFTFALRMSSCCYAQFKRHRMASRIRSPRHPVLGAVFPEWFRETGLDADIDTMLSDCATLWERLEAVGPGLGDYALTNAHTVQVVTRMNLRELYHYSRLRCDAHAQWEIRELATSMRDLAAGKAPLAASRMMGKDQFDEFDLEY